MKRYGISLLLLVLSFSISEANEHLEKLREKAVKGDPVAQNDIGVIYAKGVRVPQDSTEALKWYKKSAGQGFAPALYNIGIMYAKGYGVTKSLSKAFSMYKKAAKLGFSDAQNSLGVLYAKGEGVQQNNSKAVEWFAKAATQGNEKALNSLGIMYANGQGVPKDYVKAYSYLKVGERLNNRVAKENILKLIPDMTSEQIAEGESQANLLYEKISDERTERGRTDAERVERPYERGRTKATY